MAVSAPAVPTLRAGQKVSVRLLHVGTLPATVEGAEPGRVIVALAVPDPRIRRLAGTEAAVECVTPRGIQRFVGTLAVRDRADIIEVAISGDVERIQRREWARVQAIVKVNVFIPEDSKLGGGETTSLNVSGGGVLIQDPWRLPLGLDVKVELHLDPAGEPIRALGRVVRDGGPGQKGIRFDDLSRECSERLMKFVRERERAELRMGRDR